MFGHLNLSAFYLPGALSCWSSVSQNFLKAQPIQLFSIEEYLLLNKQFEAWANVGGRALFLSLYTCKQVLTSDYQ